MKSPFKGKNAKRNTLITVAVVGLVAGWYFKPQIDQFVAMFTGFVTPAAAAGTTTSAAFIPFN